QNGKTISWPTDSTFKTDGKYIITIKDKAGNSATFTFTIDKTKPKIVAKSPTGTTYTNGQYVKTDAKVTYSDTNYSSRSVTQNGKTISWPTDSTFKTDGKYIITIKDKAGNSATFTFTIDKTKPKIVAKSPTGTTYKNGQYVKTDTVVTYSDTNYSSRSVTQNGKAISWPTDSTFKTNGKYIITVKDKAGNSATFTFTIDKTKPKITVKSPTGTTYKNGRHVKTDTKVTYSDANYSSRSVTKNGKAISWPTDSTFKTNGKYIITIKDKAGNSATFTFTIDKTKPKISVKTTKGVTIKNGRTSKQYIKATYSDVNYSSRSVTRNGKNYTWPSKSTFKTKGTYIITIKDKAGNTSKYKFIRK
ncbi:hypothetical protein, partial [Alkalibaculum sporogenes]|uniref:hypothetical protein n=1 Tax=Alkalibaculum sporogenes TaxID=2655001 RepID=UPI001A9BFB98